MQNKNVLFNRVPSVFSLISKRPQAAAEITGSSLYPYISGMVRFYQTERGVIVFSEISGLPWSKEECNSRIFALHIHEGESCSGNNEDAFADAKTHYNPSNCDHPYHAGDLPPLFGNQGFALSMVLTDRFTVDEIIGKTVIIHEGIDDFTTQPAGNAGAKIACGVIIKLRK